MTKEIIYPIVGLAIGLMVGSFLLPSKTEETIRSEIRIESLKEEVIKERELRIQTTSTLQEQVTSLEEQNTRLVSETTSKITSLTKENRSLKQRVSKQKYRLVKPDGTIIERELSNSETQANSTIVTSVRKEFTQKVALIEQRWKSAYTKRVKEIQSTYEDRLKEQSKKHKEEIAQIQEKTTITTNEKKLRVEAGYTSEQRYYLHGSYPLLGPLTLGGEIQADSKQEIKSYGVGVGVQF